MITGWFSLLRDKHNLPSYPILSSISRFFNYHLGTVAKGSFIITLVRIPRIILLYVYSSLKGKVRLRVRNGIRFQSFLMFLKTLVSIWKEMLPFTLYILHPVTQSAFYWSAIWKIFMNFFLKYFKRGQVVFNWIQLLIIYFVFDFESLALIQLILVPVILLAIYSSPSGCEINYCLWTGAVFWDTAAYHHLLLVWEHRVQWDDFRNGLLSRCETRNWKVF